MRIGIDARPLVGQKSGIGHYLEQILRVWTKDNCNQFYLFAHKEFKVAKELERMHKVVLEGKPGTLWMQYAVPYLLYKFKIDLFWGPNYSIPLIHPKKIKTVITIHDMVSYIYPESLPLKTVLHNRFGLPLYLNKVDQIITESESTKQDIINFLGIPAEQIDITLLGVSDRFFRIDSNQNQLLKNIGLNPPYILSVGTIEPRKNLINIIKAYEKLVTKFETHHDLVIVGANGWKYSEIYGLLDLNPFLKERIHFLGYVPDDDLPTIYRGASVFVYPSFYEGFGLPPLEAMASGVPVVTSNVSSMPEVVGKAGILIDPQSIDQLADAIYSVLYNNEYAEALSEAGIVRAKKFTWERTAKHTLEVFEKVMNEGSN